MAEINMLEFANEVLANANHPLPDARLNPPEPRVTHCEYCGAEILYPRNEVPPLFCDECIEEGEKP